MLHLGRQLVYVHCDQHKVAFAWHDLDDRNGRLRLELQGNSVISVMGGDGLCRKWALRETSNGGAAGLSKAGFTKLLWDSRHASSVCMLHQPGWAIRYGGTSTWARWAGQMLLRCYPSSCHIIIFIGSHV